MHDTAAGRPAPYPHLTWQMLRDRSCFRHVELVIRTKHVRSAEGAPTPAAAAGRGSYDLTGRVYASGAMGVPLCLNVLSAEAGERVVYGDTEVGWLARRERWGCCCLQRLTPLPAERVLPRTWINVLPAPPGTELEQNMRGWGFKPMGIMCFWTGGLLPGCITQCQERQRAGTQCVP